MNFKRTPTFCALALLLPSAALLTAPASAQTPPQAAMEHHVPSPTTHRPVHRVPVHRGTVHDPVHTVSRHHPVHTLSPHHAAPRKSDHHGLN